MWLNAETWLKRSDCCFFKEGYPSFQLTTHNNSNKNIEDSILEKVEAWGMRTEFLVKKKRFDPPTLPFVWKLRVILKKHKAWSQDHKKHPQKKYNETYKYHIWCNSWVTNPLMYQWSKVFCCIMFLCFVSFGGQEVEVLKLDLLDIHTSDSVFIQVVVSSCAKMTCCCLACTIIVGSCTKWMIGRFR